jgi:23S rRNA (adenine2503-C2)-methyltransferase
VSQPPAAPERLPLTGWRPDALIAALQERGLRPAQARQAVTQLGHAVWRDPQPWPQMLDQLGRLARVAVESLCAPPLGLAMVRDEGSADGTRKLLLRTGDGEVIESVIIPATSGRRTTLCVSSQVGCARRCAFCETGRLGLRRNLQTAEIVAQLLAAMRSWATHARAAPPIRNIVFMGMGEPLDNLTAVSAAVDVFTHDLTAALGWRQVTVSTVGVAHRLPQFFDEVRAQLAVSLNAPDDSRRSRLMPINDRCGMAELKAALLAHLPPQRTVLVEYILMAGVNDARADADLLLQWLEGLPVRLNLIPANPGPDPTLTTPTADAVYAFQKHLLDRGVRALVRHPHGRDIGGACGQLAGQRRDAVQ